MISFSLKCDEGHRFDSWFQSAEAFDKLKSNGMVACAICGSTQVEKDVMAPRVAPRSSTRERSEGPLSAPASPAEQALAELKDHVEKNADYVGGNFAKEARDMHDGTTPERAIYGEARPDEARKLIEDGVPVAPLPFRPSNKSN